MNLKFELLQGAIFDAVRQGLCYAEMNSEINADEIADTTAIKALSEIKEIISDDEKSDFDMVEEIVCVFEKYRISAGGCHDFG
ncbi:MAG: hypothetical protein K5768_05780 [Firmicutes bacterium]|nr:hypothetical protein [Bacillota bacterium]